MNESLIKNLSNKLANKLDNMEFKIIKKVIKKEFQDKNILISDIGSGLCDFGEFIKNSFSNAKTTCLDINQDLVDLAISKGFEGIKGQIDNLPFGDNTFDITHCSHVIEHLTYPTVINAIDELIRITKTNGIIIIRTPLIINHRFYNDIDHIRPYPPEAILNYFRYQKQQKLSKYSIEEIKRWYTQIYCEINYYKYPGFLTKTLNLFLKLSWLFLGIPWASPNNYGIVLRKK